MRFYGREVELQALARIKETSFSSSQFTLLTGRRRVGKTTLVNEVFKTTHWLYLFVSRKNESLLCEEFQREMTKKLDTPMFGRFERIKDILEALFIYAQSTPLTVVIDEFQDFSRVNKGIFSELQDLWDRYKDSAKLNLVVCGSIYSLLIKLFEDEEEPLFGRLTAKIELKPFSPQTIKQVLYDHACDSDQEALLCAYTLTGGMPKFLTLLMDTGAYKKQDMLKYVVSMGSPFLTEGRDILISEFGQDYAVYFSILQLIASNKTAQSEIDSVLGKTSTSYIANLETRYSLIRRVKPMFAKPGSRNTRWRILDAYLAFWFRFIYANQTLVEQQRPDLLLELIEQDYLRFSGITLEDYFREKIMEEGRFNKIGSYWDRSGQNQIDLIALNDLDKKALVAEVKRSQKHIDMAILKSKAVTLKNELAAYDIMYKGLSLSDM